MRGGESAERGPGLGSGLEIVIPGEPKDIWVNVPVVEKFAHRSPFLLLKMDHRYCLIDTLTEDEYVVQVPAEPAWYSRSTTSGFR